MNGLGKIIGSIAVVISGTWVVNNTVNDSRQRPKIDYGYEISYKPIDAQDVLLKMKHINDSLEGENEKLALKKRVRLNTIKKDSVKKELIIKEKVNEIQSLNLEKETLIKEKEELLQRNQYLYAQIQKEDSEETPGFFKRIFGNNNK